jgi:hypothetical protein
MTMISVHRQKASRCPTGFMNSCIIAAMYLLEPPSRPLSLLLIRLYGGGDTQKETIPAHNVFSFLPMEVAATALAHGPGRCSSRPDWQTRTTLWNPIEYRLFSEISKNWKGKPLDSYETIINYIRTATTATGLQVRARLVKKLYKKGIKISDTQFSHFTN